MMQFLNFNATVEGPWMDDYTTFPTDDDSPDLAQGHPSTAKPQPTGITLQQQTDGRIGRGSTPIERISADQQDQLELPVVGWSGIPRAEQYASDP
jgi:hypothetical protein